MAGVGKYTELNRSPAVVNVATVPVSTQKKKGVRLKMVDQKYALPFEEALSNIIIEEINNIPSLRNFVTSLHLSPNPRPPFFKGWRALPPFGETVTVQLPPHILQTATSLLSPKELSSIQLIVPSPGLKTCCGCEREGYIIIETKQLWRIDEKAYFRKLYRVFCLPCFNQFWKRAKLVRR